MGSKMRKKFIDKRQWHMFTAVGRKNEGFSVEPLGKTAMYWVGYNWPLRKHALTKTSAYETS